MPKTLELGMEVQDKVSGFKGIAISIAKYLSGCDRVLVQPKSVKNELPESQHFDITEMVIIGDGIYVPPAPLEPKRVRTGGPRQFPSRS